MQGFAEVGFTEQTITRTRRHETRGDIGCEAARIAISVLPWVAAGAFSLGAGDPADQGMQAFAYACSAVDARCSPAAQFGDAFDHAFDHALDHACTQAWLPHLKVSEVCGARS